MVLYDIQNLSFYYPQAEKPALEGLNLTVKEGQFIAITGPTGAGKSTLAKCLNGIIPHFQGGKMQGQVLFKGKSIFQDTIANIARSVGSVFDDPESQIVSMDVEQEIAFGLENMGVAPEQMDARIAEALQMTGISHLRNSNTNELSGGQKQRLAIAAVLALYPKVLVLDEPTSELDPIGTKEIFEVLRVLNEKHGITIVLVEQKTELLARYADEIVVMNEGKVIMKGSPREVFSRQEELLNLGVKPPQVAELAHMIDKKLQHLPLTVTEGMAYIEKLLAK
ncbi:energy-coupling factor ABC transporter ATP-binding protein [Desulfofalx alkaliphila]|uniref:energy-coupling factor ABC transporter ATP-binding protein n=1 Tax=Desulfofalx alkaliphila TaxID=105483 RepID=UPI0004E1FD8C|nr:ATP-binding cassette domain-containing protein [Desulfofalx alkaliphila]